IFPDTTPTVNRKLLILPENSWFDRPAFPAENYWAAAWGLNQAAAWRRRIRFRAEPAINQAILSGVRLWRAIIVSEEPSAWRRLLSMLLGEIRSRFLAVSRSSLRMLS